MMYELLVKNARIFDCETLADIAVKDGKIASIAPNIEESLAKQVISADGHLVAPGFVDSHMHFDKVLSLGNTESPTLQQAVANFTKYLQSVAPNELKNDIQRRAREVARMCCVAGTTALRTNANVEASVGTKGMEALSQLKEEVKDSIEIQITALPSFYDGAENQKSRMAQLREAAAAGLLDYMGGAMHLHENWEELTRELFEIAVKYDLPIDFHVDESDHADVRNFMQIAQLTKAYGYEGRVSCGHVTALCAVDDATAEKAILAAKDAELHIVTLPSCNLYLMGRSDRQPIRRGVTRIREFLQAGVNICYASDNIRDPFRPIGNGDMLEEALITAQVAQMVTKSELEQVFKMGTVNPAKALGLKHYGLKEGCFADFVVMEAQTAAEAIISGATRLYVVKRGKIVAQTTKQTSCVL